MNGFIIADSDIYVIFTSLIGFFVVLAGIRSAINLAKRA